MTFLNAGQNFMKSSTSYPIDDPSKDSQSAYQPGRGTIEEIITLNKFLKSVFIEFKQPLELAFIDRVLARMPIPRITLYSQLPSVLKIPNSFSF